jgi:acetyl-CoA C-acetyltransferase
MILGLLMNTKRMGRADPFSGFSRGRVIVRRPEVLCHIKALEDKNFVREKAGVEHMFGSFPRDRMNPNGGSVALGHPFAATGARILSQALKELAALPKGSRALVSICADGGLGTVALLEH